MPDNLNSINMKSGYLIMTKNEGMVNASLAYGNVFISSGLFVEAIVPDVISPDAITLFVERHRNAIFF